jgi:hypothetical protein
VIIPVAALSKVPKGVRWESVGEQVLLWLKANHLGLPEGYMPATIPISVGNNQTFNFSIGTDVMSLPGLPGFCLISRDKVPENLGDNVEKALRTKIPKLINTPAHKRILLFERDQIFPSDLSIYAEVTKRSGSFPDVRKIDEIWFANTAVYETEKWISFELIDDRGLVEMLTFENDVLKTKRDDRQTRR